MPGLWPGFSRNKQSTEDMQKQNYIVGTGSFTDQEQKYLFENSEGHSKKCRKRKRKKKINENYGNIEGIQQNFYESSRVNPKKHINSKKEPIKTSSLTTSSITYRITNHLYINSNDFNNKLLNNCNVSHEKIGRKSNNRFRSNNETNRPNYSRQTILNSSDTNVNRKEVTISPQEKKRVKNRLKFLKEINSCDENFNNGTENMKIGTKNSRPNLSNTILRNETSTSHDISETNEQNNLDNFVVDISNEDNLQINNCTRCKKIEHKSRETDKEREVNKNVEENCLHKDIFNCDTSSNCKNKKLTLAHTKKKRKKKNIDVNDSNDLFLLSSNVNKKSNRICDKNDVLIETDSQYLTSEEVDVICTEDKDELNACYKKEKKRKKNKNEGTEVSDYNYGVSPKLSINKLNGTYTDYLKHSNDSNILLEYDNIQDTENEKNDFEIPPKVKRKKRERKFVDLIVVSDSECERVDVICTEDKDELNACYKKGKKRKKNKNEGTEVSDYNYGVSPINKLNETYTDYLKHNNDSNILLEYDNIQDSENGKNDFKIAPKVKRKKNERKFVDLTVVSDSEREIINFVNCKGKIKNEKKNFEEDCNDAPKKKSKHKSKMGNNIQENNLAYISNKTKNLLPNLPKMLKNSSGESDELNAIDEPIKKTKKKKHKSCQINDNSLEYIENKNAFKTIEGKNETLATDARSSKVDSLKNNSNRNMLNLQNCNADSQENKSILLTESPETKACSTLKTEYLKANNVTGKNDYECEVIDFISTNKKKQKFTDGELDTNDAPKRKHKLEAKKNDSENNIYGNFYNSMEEASVLSRNDSKSDSIKSENKLLSKNLNLQAKTNKRNERSKVKHIPTHISDDECEIIDYVSSYPKKKRKHITSTESDICSIPEKKPKTTHMKKSDNKVANNSAPRKRFYSNVSEFGQTGDYTEKWGQLKEEVNNEQQKNYNKLKATQFLKNLKKEHYQDDDFKNHNSISQESNLNNNNEITYKTKDNVQRYKAFDDDLTSDSSEIIISERKSTKNNKEIFKNNVSNLSNNAKGSKSYIEKSNTRGISNETDFNSTTKMTCESVKVKREDNQDHLSNSENESMVLEEKAKVKNLNTSVNISESECAIVDCVSSNKKKEIKHGMELDTHIVISLKKIPVISKINSDEKSHNENFVGECNLVEAKEEINNHSQILDNSLNYTEDEKMEEEVNEQQKNYNELDTVKSLKEEHYKDDELNVDNISQKKSSSSTNHETICETNNSTYGSQKTFGDGQSSDHSEIMSTVQDNTEIYEEDTNISTSEYQTSESSIETTTNKTDLKPTARMESMSDNIENKENDDKRRNSPNKIRRTSVFAEYMQNKEKNVQNEKKLIIPEICTDPEKIEDDIEKLQDLTVQFPFTIPPLHALTTAITKPKKEQLEKIERMKMPIKTGPFSKEEDEKIIKNWKRFCKEHNLTMNPSLFIKFPRKMKMETKINILRYIAHGLDNRLLHRIYVRFRRLLQKDKLKTGRFTPEEDKILLEFLAKTQSASPFKDLSELLHRTRASVEKRYDILTSNNKVTHWTLEMVDRFVRALLKITKCEKIKKLKHREFTTREWKKLSKSLDNISIKKLQRAWKVTIYPRLFSKEVDMKEMKKDIIHILCDRNETDWRKVDWKEIAKHFKGFTAEKIYMMFKHLSNFHVPKAKRSDLKECLDFLKNKVLKYDRIPTTHKFKKFIVKNGHITYDIEDFD